MNTKRIDERIDHAIAANKRFETVIILLSIGIFIIGFSAFIYGMLKGNVFVVAPSLIITGLLYWPIRKIEKIRKDNIALSVIPSIIKNLPPEEAAKELSKLLTKISDSNE
jgi:hypothetical protein